MLNTRKYSGNYQTEFEKNVVNKKKHRKRKNKKKFSPVAKIKLAFRIFYQGLFGAVIYILKILGNAIAKILKAVAIAVGFVLLLCLFFSGFGAAFWFAVGVYENQLHQAFIGLGCNYLAMSDATFYIAFIILQEKIEHLPTTDK